MINYINSYLHIERKVHMYKCDDIEQRRHELCHISSEITMRDHDPHIEDVEWREFHSHQISHHIKQFLYNKAGARCS